MAPELNRDHLKVHLKLPQLLVGLTVLLSAFCQMVLAAKAQTPYPVMRQLAQQALELEHSYTGGRYVDHVFRYRLFVPQPYDETKHYPLIVWLHGLGDRGTDNISHLNSFDDTLYKDGVDGAQFFVLALQCPQDNRRGLWHGWETTPETERATDKDDEMLSVMLEILDFVEGEYSVDKDAVTVVGISSGGFACWELLRREPKRFAAITVHSTGGAGSREVANFADTPIWAFHNVRDELIPIGRIRNTIADIDATGGKAALTEHDRPGHDSWRRAFAKYDLLHWLLAQHRQREDAPAPGTYRWIASFGGWDENTWPKLIAAAVGIAAAGICWQQLRSRGYLKRR